MKKGTIILLHKKKDPYDIRNYRPITLLNSDYKILTKILVARFKLVINELINKTQTGFVPKRLITENTMLCRLIQAYLDETIKPEDETPVHASLSQGFSGGSTSG